MNGDKEVSNTQDLIDSRDVIARIEYLESERDDIAPEIWEGSDEETELRILQALAEEGESSPDWQYGETLIRDSYFKEYAQDLADDIGAIDRNASWPNTCIDWDKAVSELQMDYSQVDFDGETYWIRS